MVAAGGQGEAPGEQLPLAKGWERPRGHKMVEGRAGQSLRPAPVAMVTKPEAYSCCHGNEAWGLLLLPW